MEISFSLQIMKFAFTSYFAFRTDDENADR